MCRGDRQQMMQAAATDGSRPAAAAPEDSRTGLIYNDDMGRGADPFVGQKGPAPGEPQRWNYWCVCVKRAGPVSCQLATL